MKKFVDEHLTVSENEIKDGMFYVFEKQRLIVEGAAAVGVAALLGGKLDVKGKKVVTLLTGSSIHSAEYVRIIQNRIGKRDEQ